MTDIASLGVKIDSSQAKSAAVDLGKLATAGGEAEKAVVNLGAAGGKAGKGVADTGKAAKEAASSIDAYVKKLQITAATNGLGARESKLYELAVQGATKAQLDAADAAIRMNDGYEKGVAIGQKLRTGFIAIAAAAAAAAVAIFAGTQKYIEQVAEFQGLAEKIGDTSVAVASLKTASDVSGVSFDTIASASIRLTTALSKTDDETKLAGQAITALGLNFAEFKQQSPVEQLDTIAKAMAGFKDGSEKTAVAVALFGKAGAELIPLLNDLAEGSERNTRLTEEQITAADEYTKAQAHLKSEIESFLQLASLDAVRILTDLGDLFRSIATAQGESSLATDLLRASLGGAVTIFQTIAVVASDVVFVFQGVGREIGAIAAQLAALARLDFSGFSAISDAVTDDAKRARKELDDLQARIMSIGQEKNPLTGVGSKAAEDRGFTPAKPTLTTPRTPVRGGGKTTDTSRQDARAQLQLDLEDIKKANDAIVNANSNTEKILEAQRAANLVDEKAYYAEKKRLLELNETAQEQSLQKQIARLQQESFTGKNAAKDQLDNNRKILELQAQLAKVQANAATSVQVLGIQEAAAYQKIKDSIDEARIAAEDYLETTKRRFDRDLAGLGQGDQNRERDQLKNATDDKFLQQRQQLAADLRRNQVTKQQYEAELQIINDAHQRALALDDAYYQQKLVKQGDFLLGASEALQNYYDETQNVFKRAQETVTNAFKGMEDALVSFITTGKADFKGLANSIISDLVRIAVQKNITGPLASALGGLLGGGSSTGGDALGAFINFNGLDGRASGGPVSAGKPYLVGEVGKELFIPSQSGTIIPNHALKSANDSGQQIVQNLYFTVGDVPTKAFVMDAVAASQKQSLASLSRNQRYGGTLSA